MAFSLSKQGVADQYSKIVSSGKAMTVQVDREKAWETYLNAIPDELRQSNNCNCCKSFIRQFSGIVGVDADNRLITLWDFSFDDPDWKHEYGEATRALRAYVSSLPIVGPFLTQEGDCGTSQSYDAKRGITWTHYHLSSKSVVRDPGPLISDFAADFAVLSRSLRELSNDSLVTVIDLIQQNALYRGNENLGTIKSFLALKAKFDNTPEELRNSFCWKAVWENPKPVLRIRNTSIGVLLSDLSEGKDLEKSVMAYRRIVDPANYHRTTSLVTPRMVDEAKKRVEALGLLPAMARRQASHRDLPINELLFVNRPSLKPEHDAFGLVKEASGLVNPKSLSKVSEVSIKDFLEKVIPTAKTIRVLFENRHFGNLVSMVCPEDPSAGGLFKYDNGFSWSYTGQVADSIKERVKAAGGNVTGDLRISLSWSNYDDLDLHVYEPGGEHLYYGDKRSRNGGVLDVDMNAHGERSLTPVENIIYKRLPKAGTYRIFVNLFTLRDRDNSGFDVEVEAMGQVTTFSFPRNEHTEVATILVKDGEAVIAGSGNTGSPKSYSSKIKWGLPTGFWHTVKAITTSPNHWGGKAAGLKHFFFLLDGCKADENLLPFYNEFLSPSLEKDRKVFELVSRKSEVAKVEDEASGLGFSDSSPDSLFVEVESSFKHILKVRI